MLPITATDSAVAERLITIVCNSAQLLPQIWSVCESETGNSLTQYELFKVISLSPNVDALLVASQDVDHRVIEACDGVIFVVSAAEGIAPEISTIWNVCVDNDIPRLLVVTDLFSSYTDFDEMVAIAKRILQPNIETRYLPMADDNAEKMAGIFDLLSGEIWDYTTGTRKIRPADEEHISLTSEDRAELLEGIAVSAFTDDDLSVHQSGLTLVLQKYVDAWKHPHITATAPLENSHGFEIVLEWIHMLPARWLPEVNGTVTQESPDSDLMSEVRFGLGISSGIARMWGPPSTDLVVHQSSALSNPASTVHVTSKDVFRSCLIDSSVNADDTICESDKTFKLRAPVL